MFSRCYLVVIKKIDFLPLPKSEQELFSWMLKYKQQLMTFHWGKSKHEQLIFTTLRTLEYFIVNRQIPTVDQAHPQFEQLLIFVSALIANTDLTEDWLQALELNYPVTAYLSLHMNCTELMLEQTSNRREELRFLENHCNRILSVLVNLSQEEKTQLPPVLKDYPYLCSTDAYLSVIKEKTDDTNLLSSMLSFYSNSLNKTTLRKQIWVDKILRDISGHLFRPQTLTNQKMALLQAIKNLWINKIFTPSQDIFLIYSPQLLDNIVTLAPSGDELEFYLLAYCYLLTTTSALPSFRADKEGITLKKCLLAAQVCFDTVTKYKTYFEAIAVFLNAYPDAPNRLRDDGIFDHMKWLENIVSQLNDVSFTVRKAWSNFLLELSKSNPYWVNKVKEEVKLQLNTNQMHVPELVNFLLNLPGEQNLEYFFAVDLAELLERSEQRLTETFPWSVKSIEHCIESVTAQNALALAKVISCLPKPCKISSDNENKFFAKLRILLKNPIDEKCYTAIRAANNIIWSPTYVEQLLPLLFAKLKSESLQLHAMITVLNFELTPAQLLEVLKVYHKEATKSVKYYWCMETNRRSLSQLSEVIENNSLPEVFEFLKSKLDVEKVVECNAALDIITEITFSPKKSLEICELFSSFLNHDKYTRNASDILLNLAWLPEDIAAFFNFFESQLATAEERHKEYIIRIIKGVNWPSDLLDKLLNLLDTEINKTINLYTKGCFLVAMSSVNWSEQQLPKVLQIFQSQQDINEIPGLQDNEKQNEYRSYCKKYFSALRTVSWGKKQLPEIFNTLKKCVDNPHIKMFCLQAFARINWSATYLPEILRIFQQESQTNNDSYIGRCISDVQWSSEQLASVQNLLTERIDYIDKQHLDQEALIDVIRDGIRLINWLPEQLPAIHKLIPPNLFIRPSTNISENTVRHISWTPSMVTEVCTGVVLPPHAPLISTATLQTMITTQKAVCLRDCFVHPTAIYKRKPSRAEILAEGCRAEEANLKSLASRKRAINALHDKSQKAAIDFYTLADCHKSIDYLECVILSTLAVKSGFHLRIYTDYLIDAIHQQADLRIELSSEVLLAIIQQLIALNLLKNANLSNSLIKICDYILFSNIGKKYSEETKIILLELLDKMGLSRQQYFELLERILLSPTNQAHFELADKVISIFYESALVGEIQSCSNEEGEYTLSRESVEKIKVIAGNNLAFSISKLLSQLLLAQKEQPISIDFEMRNCRNARTVT